MVPGRVIADAEDAADLFVGKPFGHQLQDLMFSWSQVGTSHAIRQLRRNVSGEVSLIGAHKADRIE